MRRGRSATSSVTAAAANGDKVALEVVGRAKTYAEIDHDTDRVATGLAGLGFDVGRQRLP